MEQNNLNSRQWRLKEWLEKNHISGKYHSIEEVVANVVDSYGQPYYTLNLNPRIHDKCIILSNDIREINWNYNYGFKIIIKDAKGGIKLAENRQEFDTWFEKEFNQVEKKYKYLNNLKSKVERDGVMPFINQAMNVVENLTPTKVFAREFVNVALYDDVKEEVTVILCDSVKFNKNRRYCEIIGGTYDSKRFDCDSVQVVLFPENARKRNYSFKDLTYDK